MRIGDGVEIGALTAIDRALLEETVIEDGTKIDNLCLVAHNCHVGPECVMAGGVKLGGSVRLGRGVIIGGHSAVADHVTIGDGAKLAGGTGVHNHVPPGAVMSGLPARPIAEHRRIFALLGRLPQMWKRIRKLEQRAGESGHGDSAEQ